MKSSEKAAASHLEEKYQKAAGDYAYAKTLSGVIRIKAS